MTSHQRFRSIVVSSSRVGIDCKDNGLAATSPVRVHGDLRYPSRCGFGHCQFWARCLMLSRLAVVDSVRAVLTAFCELISFLQDS